MKVMGFNLAINVLLVLILIYMTVKTHPVLNTVQFKVLSLSLSLFRVSILLQGYLVHEGVGVWASLEGW